MTRPRLLLAMLLVLTLLPAAPGTAVLSDALTPEPAADALDAVDLADALDGQAVTDVASSPNMTHVANLRWNDALRRADSRPVDSQGGTDVEFARIGDRDYAIVGTYRNGLQVIDITDQAAPVQVGTYDCRVLQGDVQVFTRPGQDSAGDAITRTIVTYAVEGGGSNSASSPCYADLGIGPQSGTLFIDVTDPTTPRSIAFQLIPGGTHNQTVNPTGEYMYNSNSGGCGNCIEVYDIRDLGDIRLVTKIPTPNDAHDITFSADGTRAYAASINHSAIIDTTDPAAPRIISIIEDPAIYLHHQADPVVVGEREFLVINDELLGAGGNEYCPGGGLHVWEITGDMETAPEKVGAFFAPDITVREGAPTGLGGTVTCTSHVFRIYPEQQKIVIGWFGAGVRVIDISGLGDASVVASGGIAGTSVGVGMTEVGYFRFTNSDAWSAKVLSWDEDGSAHIFANDQTRGLDVYRFDASAPVAADPGSWLSPVEALRRAGAVRAAGLPSGALVCDLLLGRARL